MKFLVYKLYRFAKAQEETVDAEFGFMGLVSVFEMFHLAIIISFIRDFFGFKIEFSNFFISYSGWIITIVGLALNYYFFIKTRLIYKINSFYEKKNYSIWKGNLLFFGYILLLFLIMFIQTWYYKNYVK